MSTKKRKTIRNIEEISSDATLDIDNIASLRETLNKLAIVINNFTENKEIKRDFRQLY